MKKIFRIVAIIYDIVALFWCYVITSDIIYELTPIGVNEGSIGIIGGADWPTAIILLKSGAIFSLIFFVSLILLNLVNAVLLTIAAFKPKIKRALNIWLIVLLGVALTFFIIIPSQMYIVALYAAVLRLGYLAAIFKIAYFVLSIAAIVLNILALIKRKDVKMKKIIAIVLVFVFLLSICGCKSGDTSSDITSEKPQYISLPKVEAIEVSTNATKKGTIITDKKDFEFLSKYYYEREIDMDEFSKLVDMSKVVLIKITADMVLYLLEDGRLIEPVMSGDSGVTERTFSVYTADKKSILNKANLEAVLGKYKKSNDTDKTESEDTSSKTDTGNTSSDGPTICPPKPETEEPTLPQVKYSPTGNKKMFSDIINLDGGGFAVTGYSETEEEAFPIIRIYNDKCNLVKEHKIDLPWGFSRLIECSGGGFIALTEDMPYIIKISKDFKVEWTKEYKDPTGNASAYDIKEISPDCFVILYTDFNEENDMEHVISFFDSEGNLIEKQTFIVVESFDIAGNIVADGKGGVYLFTYCNQSTVDKYKLCEKEYNREDETDAAIIHFNAERKVDWSKVVSSTKGRDWIEEATIDSKGNFYIALGTDWKGNDKLWDMMYVDDSCGNRRMLLKLDKKGNIVYKVPLTSDAMGVDQTHGIHLNNGKVNVVGMAYYFDKYNSKYPCKKIDKEDEGDRLFVAYNLSIDDKKGKELHRDLFLNSVENEPRGSVVLKNGTVVIAGSVSAMYNSLDLTFYDDYDKFGALFIYEN